MIFSDPESIFPPPPISYEEFQSKEGLEEFKSLAWRYWRDQEIDNADDLLLIIDSLLKKYNVLQVNAPDIFEEYQNIKFILVIATLSFRPPNEIKNLFTEGLLRIIKQDIDIRPKLFETLYFHDDGAYKGEERNLIVRYLQENKERIGINEIKDSGETPLPPTIGNWLRDYERFFPSFTLKSNLEEITYINQNANAQKLTEADKKIILNLLQIYNLLRYPTENVRLIQGINVSLPPVLEKKTSNKNILVQKKEVASPKVVSEELTLKLKKIYQGDLGEQDKIIKEEELIRKQINKNKNGEKNKKLAQILEKGLDQKDKIKSIAVSRLLAEGGGLSELMAENKRFTEPFLGYLRKKEEETPGLVEGFKLEPTAPNYLSLFLQYLLREKLMLNENDSGRVGMQLANIFKKAGNEKYSKLVYFDVNGEKFKWNM